MRRILLSLGLLIAVAALALIYCFAEACRDPIVRETSVALPHWPAGAKPVRMVLISDIHIGSPAMDEERLERLAGQVNALHPDAVVIAGDFIFGHDPQGARKLGGAMIAPLSHLKAPLGIFAVLGNHDWWTGDAAVRSQLKQANVRLLENEAAAAGPLAIGGIGDNFTQHDGIGKTVQAVRALPGAPVLFTHSPDIAPDLPLDMPLLLAGHTHCGQGNIPFYGPISDVSVTATAIAAASGGRAGAR